jgi:hypothetical protein
MAEDKIRYLAWSACDKIDKLIDLIDDESVTFEEVHAAINRVRAHMEARSMQTATPLMLPVVNARGDDYDPPKGPPVEPALIAENLSEFQMNLAIYGTAVIAADKAKAELAALLGL